MADKKENKGKISSYNDIPVKQREYYYDREETDKVIQKDFGDILANLRDMNQKVKKEAEEGETPKLNIDISEGLLARAQWINDQNKAKREFDSYKSVGGKKNFEGFLRAAIKAIQNGKEIKSGKDVANIE